MIIFKQTFSFPSPSSLLKLPNFSKTPEEVEKIGPIFLSCRGQNARRSPEGRHRVFSSKERKPEAVFSNFPKKREELAIYFHPSYPQSNTFTVSEY